MAKVVEVKGSIFDSKCQVIVNTVNCKGVMGKGLALEFRFRYPEMFKDYSKRCTNGQIKTGQLTLWKKSNPWIINFPTKDDWKNPSKMEYIEDGLQFFVQHYKDWGVKSIAFPRLGSNHGGLKWFDVRKILYNYLENLDLIVELYEFDPNYQDRLFLSLIERLKTMSLKEYVQEIGLSPKIATMIKQAIDNNSVSSFSSIRYLPGLGEKSIVKIYSFATKEQPSIQKKLFIQSN